MKIIILLSVLLVVKGNQNEDNQLFWFTTDKPDHSQNNTGMRPPSNECPEKGKGTPANLGQYPYHVIIMPKDHSCPATGSICGGSIINNHWILTSADCLFGYIGARVYGGVIDLHKLSEADYMSGDVPQSSFIFYPGYKHRSTENNIALIHVCSPIKPSKHVSTIELPRKDDLLSDGFSASSSGFRTIRKPVDMEQTKMTGVTKQIDTEGLCDDTYDEGKFLQEQHLCVKPGDGGSACVCDRGCGLSVIERGRQELYGILNFYARDGCDKGYPDVYSRISHYLDWIHSTTGIHKKNGEGGKHSSKESGHHKKEGGSVEHHESKLEEEVESVPDDHEQQPNFDDSNVLRDDPNHENQMDEPPEKVFNHPELESNYIQYADEHQSKNHNTRRRSALKRRRMI